MFKTVMLFATLISASAVFAAPSKSPQTKQKKVSRGPASASSVMATSASVASPSPVKRSIAAAACSDAACLCEEVKKLSVSCLENVDKISEEASRKQFRQLQSDISFKRRQISDQGKSCSAFAQADICFERSIKNITQKSPRQRDIKNENASELLGFGSDILIKLGNQPAGRTPASR